MENFSVGPFFFFVQNSCRTLLLLYTKRKRRTYTDRQRENCWVRRRWWWWGRHIAVAACAAAAAASSETDDYRFFSARWTSSEKKKTMQFFRSSRPVQHGSQAQTLVVYYIFIYIHSSLIPLLCNHNNTIKDNKIQINAGRCKYAFIRSSFQPHTPFRIMSKYKKIRVLSPYIFLCPKEEKWK